MEVPQSIRPPREVYRYWPTGELVCKGSGTHSQRFIFANQQFTSFETEKLNRLKAALHDQRIPIPPEWDDTVLLRLTYGTHWKTRNAVAAVVDHLQWRRDIFAGDYKLLYSQVLPLLEGGCLYVHGRDCRYRPCIIMNYPKFNFREVTATQHTIDEYIPLIGFLLDYVIENMFLPGQVENWITITDMGNMSLSDMPISVSATQHIRKLIEMLQANYRCRLAHNFVINAPTSVSVIWAIIKRFLDKDTVERISLTGRSTDKNLLAIFNPGQLEERYGGTAPNLTQFWPPVVPDSRFEAPGQVLGALLSRHSSYPLHLTSEVSMVSEPQPSMGEEKKSDTFEEKKVDLSEEKKSDTSEERKSEASERHYSDLPVRLLLPSTKDTTAESALDPPAIAEPLVILSYEEIREEKGAVEEPKREIETAEKTQRVILEDPIQPSFGCFCGEEEERASCVLW